MNKIERVYLKLARAEALTLQKGRCYYCKAPLTAKVATADHKHPRVRYGSNSKENIAAACRDCNVAKGSLSEGQFFKLIKRGFPTGQPTQIIAIWALRRIWKRTFRACERIERAAGISIQENSSGAA